MGDGDLLYREIEPFSHALFSEDTAGELDVERARRNLQQRRRMMRLEDLTPEQKDKVKACKTPEEILALAKEEGYELSDEELNAVSGGLTWFAQDHGDVDLA